MTLEKYGVESCPDWLTDDINEARAVAQRDKSTVIAYTFEFTDSEVVEDYREAVDKDE